MSLPYITALGNSECALYRAPYVSLGKQVKLLDIDGNGGSDMLGRIVSVTLTPP